MPLEMVVLDGVPLNPGDLNWNAFREFGNLTVHENSAPDQTADRVRDAEVVFTNKVPLDAAAFAAAARLKLVCVLATGYNIIDLEASRAHGVTVCNVPGYSSHFTAQTTIALLLELAHHTGAHDAAVHAGQWSESSSFSFWNYPLVELSGKTALIVGLGAIGNRVALILAALGMRIVVAKLPGRETAAHALPRLPLSAALPLADVVTLHCPLTESTRDLINKTTLSLMRSNALLVNTARGPLVDEAAVAAALRAGRIAGYACDVLSHEPPPADNPLLDAPNCIITPHISWASRECRQRLLDDSVANLRAFLDGHAQNVVSA